MLRRTFSLICLLHALSVNARVRAVTPPASPSVVIVGELSTYVDTLAAASDGSIIFNGQAVGVLRPTGEVETLSTAEGSSGALAVTPDGVVWSRYLVPGSSFEGLRRIERAESSDFPVRFGAALRSIVAGDDDSVWFTEVNKDRFGTCSRDGAVKEIALPPSLDSPAAIARTNDGSVWLATRRSVARYVGDDHYDVFAADSLFIGRHPNSGTTKQYSLPPDPLGDVTFASSVVVDRTGDIWVALNRLGGGALIARLHSP